MMRSRDSSAAAGGGGGPVRRGLWFEDYSVGHEVVTAARTITESDVVAFAGLSGDFNPLHVDAPFAERTAFRGRIAHGLLVESIARGLVAQTGVFDGTIAALAEVRSTFVRPTPIGTTIHVRLEVLELQQDPPAGRGRVRLRKRVYDSESELVAEGEWLVVVRRDRSRRKTPDAASEASA